MADNYQISVENFEDEIETLDQYKKLIKLAQEYNELARKPHLKDIISSMDEEKSFEALKTANISYARKLDELFGKILNQ